MGIAEKTIQRSDGSEVKIVAQEFFGTGLHRSVGVHVLRRENEQATWKLCGDRPHPDWRTMSVDEYVKNGRSEVLQTVTHAEILKVTSALRERSAAQGPEPFHVVLPGDSAKVPMWPTYRPQAVHHVGSLVAADKGREWSSSLEGNGLSVSEHPDEWRAIARLGDAPQWSLTTNDQAAFLDARALTQAQWAEVMDWGLAQGLVQPIKVARVSWIDIEDETDRYQDFNLGPNGDDLEALEQSRLELHDLAACGCQPKVECLDAWAAQPALSERIGFKVVDDLCRDLVLTVFVEDELFEKHGLQGVWWRDQLAPASYSAPRGVIHLKALPAWGGEVVRSAQVLRERQA